MGFFSNWASGPEQNDEPEVLAPKPYNAPRPLVASAQRLNFRDTREADAFKKRRQSDKWQAEAFDYLDLVGEIKFAANMIANVLSRINIYAAYIADPSQVPARIGSIDHLDEDFKEKADSALYLLDTGNGGASGLLRNAGMNFFVAGECYLVREPAKWSTGEPEKWQIRSVDEIVQVPNPVRGPASPQFVYAIKPRSDASPKDYIILPENGYCARLWRSHPRYMDEADSSLRGVLDFCNDLLLISRYASSVTKSRMHNGVIFIADELSMSAQGDETMVDPSDTSEPVVTDTFVEDFYDAILEPISDPSSPHAAAPVVVRGGIEYADGIKHIEITRAFDPEIAAHAERLLNRIISGLDIPKEMVGGMSNLKGANAKIIEETMFSSHIEPLTLLICDALTTAFLRPVLRAMGFPEHHVMRTVVWYDPSAVSAKPSKSESATIGYDKQIISADAWRRAHGFSVGDAPTQLEIAQRLAVSKGLISEPLAEKLISTLIPDLMGDLRKEQLQQSNPGSADALNEALDGGEVHEGSKVDTVEEDGSGTIDTSTQDPPNLLEP